nr:MAG TPA: hypothetical protein [Caudoviricetes sp.]
MLIFSKDIRVNVKRVADQQEFVSKNSAASVQHFRNGIGGKPRFLRDINLLDSVFADVDAQTLIDTHIFNLLNLRFLDCVFIVVYVFEIVKCFSQHFSTFFRFSY